MAPDELKVLEAMQAELHGIHAQLVKINGSVQRHDEEIFGSKPKSTIGLRREMRGMHDLVVSATAAARTLKYLVSLLGIGNLAGLLWAITKVSGA